MADQTAIEWTDATWNPVTGCTEVSPGCDHCYAKTFAERFRGTPGHHFERGFDVVLRETKLELPLSKKWAAPRRIFVNSMSDLFHDEVPDEYIAHVFAVMALAPQHTFQVLTKRHGRMRSLLNSQRFIDTPSGWISFEAAVRNVAFNMRYKIGSGRGTPDGLPNPDELPWPLPNVWLGVSVENQQWADIRIPALLGTSAAVRFLSMEPLLGPVSLFANTKIDTGVLVDWVIVGGESGRGARPMHPSWARQIRYECITYGIPFLFKQWGEWVPEAVNVHRDNDAAAFLALDGSVRLLVDGVPAEAPRARGADITIRRAGKKLAGRHLDGRTWDEFPEPVNA